MSRRTERKTPPQQDIDQASGTWKTLPWKTREQHVFRLQKRIDRASQRGQTSKVEPFQQVLLKSEAARLLAVRRVTQDHQGKTPAGIDGGKSVNPNQRLLMAQALHPQSQHRQKAKPVRRVCIPKPGKKDERRPLGMPILVERAQHTLVKLALEPAWEAVFEENSSGFRPGRSSHDARGASLNGIRFTSQFGLDAAIKGCFDHIDHKAVLQKLNIYPQLRHLMRGWLKAGGREGGDFTPTETGTPQGGPLSPLLATSAWHGIEKAAAKGCSKQKGHPSFMR